MVSKDLEQLCNDVLIDSMSEGLKQAIDACLDKGENPYRILDFIRSKTGSKHATVYLQAWAYLERKLGGSPIDPNRRPPR